MCYLKTKTILLTALLKIYLHFFLLSLIHSVRDKFADKCNNLKSLQITHWQTQQSVTQTKQKII